MIKTILFCLFIFLSAQLVSAQETITEMPDVITGYYCDSSLATMDTTEATTDVSMVLYDDLTTSEFTSLSSFDLAKYEGKRYVQVFIVDPDDNVPIEQSVLYKSEPFFTDKTNRELWFDVEVKEILERHNKLRKSLIDKKASRKYGKDIHLEEARIKDLKMIVIEIVGF